MAEIVGIQDLLKAARKLEDVEVPDTGGLYVRLQGLGADDLNEMDRLLSAMDKERVPVDAMAFAVSRSMLDQEGKLIGDGPDRELLIRLPAAVLTFLFQKVTEISRLRKEDTEKLLGNLSPSPGGDSPID